MYAAVYTFPAGWPTWSHMYRDPEGFWTTGALLMYYMVWDPGRGGSTGSTSAAHCNRRLPRAKHFSFLFEDRAQDL